MAMRKRERTRAHLDMVLYFIHCNYKINEMNSWKIMFERLMLQVLCYKTASGLSECFKNGRDN